MERLTPAEEQVMLKLWKLEKAAVKAKLTITCFNKKITTNISKNIGTMILKQDFNSVLNSKSVFKDANLGK